MLCDVKYPRVLFGVIVSFFLDRLTKIWIVNHLVAFEEIPINFFMSFRIIYNDGVAFSFFQGYGEYGRWILVFLGMMIVACIGFWVYQEKNMKKILLLSVMIGGALGNIVDRVLYGGVIDFIDLYYEPYHWPTFNLADTMLVCGGLGLLFLDTLEVYQGKKHYK